SYAPWSRSGCPNARRVATAAPGRRTCGARSRRCDRARLALLCIPRTDPQSGTTESAAATPSHAARAGAEVRHRRLRHVLVLLGRPAAHAARTLDHAVSEDRHGAHARDHVAALGGDDALDDRCAGALGQLAAGAAEGDRGDRLALGAIDAAPD